MPSYIAVMSNHENDFYLLLLFLCLLFSGEQDPEICILAKILDIENTKNFNGCLILSPHDFIYVKFQLPIYCQRKNLYVIKILHVRVS